MHTPWEDMRGQQWQLVDPTSRSFVRFGDDLVDGIFVQLLRWDWHLLRIEPLSEPSTAHAGLLKA